MKDAQKPDHVSLNTLLSRIKEGRYVIPDFQREFEWTPWDIRDLVRSIFLDYYIGSLLLWKGKKENFEALSCEPIYGYIGKGNPEAIVLDGQQRLTALYYVFTAPEINLPNKANRAIYYINIQEFMAEEYDKAFYYEWLSKRWAKVLKDNEFQYENHIFPLSVVGAGGWELGNWVQGYYSYWKEKSEELSKNKDVAGAEIAKRHTSNAKDFGTFLKELTEQYQISYIELDRELSVDKICDIFTQINSRGVRLDVFDLINALLKPKGLQLKKLWRDAASRLDFVDTPKMNVYILQVMSIIRQAYCSPKYLYFLLPGQEKPIRDADGTRRKEVLVPDIEDFKNRWVDAITALENAIKTLKHPQEYGAIKASYLPYVSILPIFASLQAHKKTLPAAYQLGAQRKIQQWYWASVFTNRYSGSVESTSAKDFLDIKAWMESDEKSPALIDEFKQRFRTLDLRNETKRGTSIYNAIFNLLILNGARDWVTGNVAQDDDLDDHHIVPLSWGKKNSLGDKVNTILNRAPLTSETNRQIIGDNLPNAYLPKMIKANGIDKVKTMLNAHFVSEKGLEILLRNPFTVIDFQDFITERQHTILDAIENLLIKERVSLEPKLRELDEEIEKIELSLRSLIVLKLNNDLARIPSHIMIKVQERVTRAIQKNAILDASNFQNLHGILEYFDLRELQDVIVNAALWMEFEIYFANKNILIGKFDQLAELRNSIRHSRSVTEVAKKEGEASIIWFQTIFNKHNVAPSKNSIEFDLSDFDEIKQASEDNDKAKGDNPKRDTSKYDVTVDGKSFLKQAKRNAIFLIVKNLYSNGVPPEKFAILLYGKSASIFFEVDGHHESEQFIQIASQSQTRNFDRDRWFCGDGELFYSNGKTFAFTKMWGVGWPEALNILTKEFPDSNIRFEVSRE